LGGVQPSELDDKVDIRPDPQSILSQGRQVHAPDLFGMTQPESDHPLRLHSYGNIFDRFFVIEVEMESYVGGSFPRVKNHQRLVRLHPPSKLSLGGKKAIGKHPGSCSVGFRRLLLVTQSAVRRISR